MSHARFIPSSRTLLVLLSSTLALACNKDEPKATATTAAGTPATPAPGTPAAVPATPPANGPVAVAAMPAVPAVADGLVLGHFALVNPSQLLKDVKSQLVPPQYANVLEEASLRAMLALALEQRGDLARKFDLAAPVGCAVVEAGIDDVQVSCVFGYTGGAKAFMTDLGEQNRLPDASGHTAAYQFESKVAFIDELGDKVVTSVGENTFKKSQSYLQRSILDRAGSMRGDLEFVLHAATIFERYRSVIEPLLKNLPATTPPATGNPAIDGAMQAFSSYSGRTNQNSLQRIAEIEAFSLYLSVEPEGVAIGGSVAPKAGTRLATEMATYGALKLDPAFAGSAPSGTVSLLAMAMPTQTHEMASVAETRQVLAQAWAVFSGGDAAAIEAAIAAYQRENAGLYDGHMLVALGREPGALFGLEVMSRLQAGKAARDSWKAWSAAFTPEVVLGKEFSKYLTWNFTPDAANIDGVPVDRWTIAPGAEAKAAMEQNMPPEARSVVDRALGGLFLNIDRAETDGRVIFTMAPTAEGNYMKRAIAAAQGKGNIGGEPGLTRVLARDGQTGGVLAVDVREGAAWVRDLGQFMGKPLETPPGLGTDLGDFYFTFRYNPDGSLGMEYMMSQQLIGQIKAMIPG